MTIQYVALYRRYHYKSIKPDMDINSTFNLLIKHAYNETEQLESATAQHLIDTDIETAELYDDIVLVKKCINEALFSPSSKVEKNILAYAS